MIGVHRPDINLENHEAVYDFYLGLEPVPEIARLGHFAVSQLYKPQVSFEEGADGQISRALELGNNVMLLMNHVYPEDVVHAPALLKREKVFNPMMTRTNIYGMASLTSNGGMQRVLFDGLGMIPVFRRKDAPKDIDPELLGTLQSNAREGLIYVGADKLSRGFHADIFPEGERSENFDKKRKNPNIVKPLKDSFVEMIYQSNRPDNVLIVTAGLSYPTMPFDRPSNLRQQVANRNARRKPHLYIPKPIEVSATNREEILELSHATLQFAVDSARKIRALLEYADSVNDGSLKAEIDETTMHDPDLEV